MNLHVPHPHPGVRRPHELSRGERAADLMKRVLATWAALGAFAAFMGWWMLWNSHVHPGHHWDPYPWVLLNLCLSTLAGLQCFVLLIANKRGEQIAAELAMHAYRLILAAFRILVKIAAALKVDISDELAAVDDLLSKEAA